MTMRQKLKGELTIVADGGSTSVEWAILERNGTVKRTKSQGMSPLFNTSAELLATLTRTFDGSITSGDVQEIYFYGAACGPDQPAERVQKALEDYFKSAQIIVDSDMMAAAIGCWKKEAGVVGIIGTGSNAGYYDGTQLHYRVPTLGYILGDEGSGAWFGRRLVRDWLYNLLPRELAAEMERQHGEQLGVHRLKNGLYRTEGIVRQLYEGEKPNAFLASFAPLLTQRIAHPYCQRLLEEGFNAFVETLCMPHFAERRELRVAGSVAWFGKDILEAVCQRHNIILGGVTKEPIEGLIEHYRGKTNP